MFWESPFTEEHALDTSKKRRIEQQQRTLVVNSIIKAKSTHEGDDVEDYLDTVNKVTQWADSRETRYTHRCSCRPPLRVFTQPSQTKLAS